MSVATVRLQPDIEQGLESLAASMQRSKSWIINQALQSYLHSQTLERERWAQTVEAMQQVAAGETVSGEAVDAWLQSWGSAHELPTPKSSRPKRA